MPEKYDPDSSPGVKLLRAFRKLLLNDRKHYQSDLAQELTCSPQTIIRIMNDIETVIGINLVSGVTGKRKWYRIQAGNPRMLGLHYEELRYLSVCRELAAQTLPDQILSRVDDTIFNLSIRMAEDRPALNPSTQEPMVTFFSKGKIDYRGFYPMLEKILLAIEKKLICKISYRALGRKENRLHDFVPHKLISMNQVLYIVGASLKDTGEGTTEYLMNLAFHRIKGLELTETSVNIEFPALSPQAFGLPWHEPCFCRIHFRPGKAAEYVAERIWSQPQKISWQGDGSLVLELVTCSMPELEAWARSFGDEVLEVEEVVGRTPEDAGLPQCGI